MRLDRDGVIERLSHQELGDMVGACRETVTKILAELEKEGEVELGRRRIRVLDRARLAAALDE
jgi:CRP-like cAMP-binding protein